MRVERDKNLKKARLSTDKSGVVERKVGEKSLFNQELNQQRYTQTQEFMQEILKQIDDLNKKLQRDLTIENSINYSNLVKNFLMEATTKAYFIKQERGLSRRGRIMLISINQIDMEVENLVETFMIKEKKPLDILAVIDKIRGMLVDLTV